MQNRVETATTRWTTPRVAAPGPVDEGWGHMDGWGHRPSRPGSRTFTVPALRVAAWIGGCCIGDELRMRCIHPAWGECVLDIHTMTTSPAATSPFLFEIPAGHVYGGPGRFIGPHHT